jgi:hypothetical protein
MHYVEMLLINNREDRYKSVIWTFCYTELFTKFLLPMNTGDQEDF